MVITKESRLARALETCQFSTSTKDFSLAESPENNVLSLMSGLKELQLSCACFGFLLRSRLLGVASRYDIEVAELEKHKTRQPETVSAPNRQRYLFRLQTINKENFAFGFSRVCLGVLCSLRSSDTKMTAEFMGSPVPFLFGGVMAAK